MSLRALRSQWYSDIRFRHDSLPPLWWRYILHFQQSQMIETNRQNVKMTIIELFETERNYISNLLTIMDVSFRSLIVFGHHGPL